MVVHRAGAEGSVFGWCIKLTIWPLTSSPASNRSVPPPFSPESVFTNGAMHANDLHIWVVLSYFLRDLELDNERSNFAFWDDHCRYLKMIFKYVQTLMSPGIKTICYLCEQTSELKYHTYCVWKIIQIILNQLDTNGATSSIINNRKHCSGVSVD